MVEYSKGDGNSAFYLHRRGSFPPVLLFQQQPSLTNYTLAATHPIVVTARDGLKLPGYLTLPTTRPELLTMPSTSPSQLPGSTRNSNGNGNTKQQKQQLPAGLAGDVPPLQSFRGLHSNQPHKHQHKAHQQQGGGVGGAVSKVVDWRLPMVLMVHGGPWKRTSWGSNAGLTQWLANRGYAVLNVNFRGSTGYGKAFTHEGMSTCM